MRQALWIGLAAIAAIGSYAAIVQAQQTAPSELPGCVYNLVAPTLADKQSIVQQCDSNGQLRIAGTINASSSATATAAAPSYMEGSDEPLSQNLTGDLRTIAKQSGAWTVSGTGTAGTAATGVVTVQGIASMTPLLVTPAANSAVNVAQINGVTPLMGTGNTGTGSPRVTISTDNAAVAGFGVGATAAAPPANADYMGANGSGATGGLLAGLKTCDLHAKYDASDTGRKTLVTGVSGRKVYVCGFILANGAVATNLSLYEGSDADCATNSAALTPAYQVLANQSIGAMAAFWTGLVVSTNAYYLCVNASGANAHQAEVWYTIQ